MGEDCSVGVACSGSLIVSRVASTFCTAEAMSIGPIFFVLSSAAAQEAGTRIVGAQGIEPYPFHTQSVLSAVNQYH